MLHPLQEYEVLSFRQCKIAAISKEWAMSLEIYRASTIAGQDIFAVQYIPVQHHVKTVETILPKTLVLQMNLH